MPTPRMTRQNQAKWLFAFIISIVATLFGVKNLTWFYQQVFNNDQVSQNQISETVPQGNSKLF